MKVEGKMSDFNLNFTKEIYNKLVNISDLFDLKSEEQIKA